MDTQRFKNGCWLGVIASFCLLLGFGGPARAFQFTLGEVDGSLDTTLSYGVSWRADEPDRDLIGTANGGRAYSVNGDDGNLNYDRNDPISKLFKITSDFQLQYADVGMFLRGTAFYDMASMDDSRARTELSDDALDLVGKDADLLDAYVWWNFDLADKPGQLRLGNQVLSWGESTFIQNSINTINPVDVNKLRVPGSELREALVPVGMVSGSLSANDYVSVEGFYQYNWEKTEIDPPGSYWSTNDFVGAGGNKVMLGWGDVSDLGTDLGPLLGGFDPNFLAVPRGPDDKPQDDGQYGVALRMIAPALNDTEFGLYFINYHSRLPIISARTGVGAVGDGTFGTLVGLGVPAPLAAPVAVNAYAKTANYFLEYPENIQLLGASFNTQLAYGGIALQGEVSYRHDAPVQIDDVELLLAALSPLGFNPAYDFNQLGAKGDKQVIHGYEQFDISQVQTTATKLFGGIFGADQLALVGEVGVTYVHDFPDKDKLRLESSGTYVSGNPFHSILPLVNPAIPFGGAHAGKPAEGDDAFADQTSWGYRLLARADYNNAIGAITLSPRIGWAHDVDGNSPGPGGNFLEDRKSVSFGIGADYQKTWSADLSYTDYFGAGRYNLSNDRDFVAFNLKYSF